MTEKIISIVVVSALGALALFILLGAIWGAVRGAKRAAMRLGTVIVALVIALLLTPLMSKMMVNVTIPGLGKSGGDYLKELVFGSGVGEQLAEASPEIVSSVQAYATVFVNFIMFFILYIVFTFLSWIIYAVLASKFAPVKNKKGEENPVPIKRYRWSGLGIGLVTGFIFFAFFMIPINGTFQALNAAASHSPVLTGYEVETRASLKEEDDITGTLVKIDDAIKEANSQIQSSAFGKIAKFTGMRALGGWGTGYLSTVKANGQTLSVRDDLVNLGKLAGDGLAVTVSLTGGEGDILGKIENWTEKDYEMLKSMVNRLFSVGVIRTTFEHTESVVGVLQENNTLDGTLENVSTAEGFTDAAYEGIRVYTKYDKLRNDLVSLVDILKILFADGMYDDVKGIIDNFDNPAALKIKADAFDNGNAEKLTKAFFNINLVQAALTGESLANLYKEPLANALEIDKENAEIKSSSKNWEKISADAAKTLVEFVNTLASISEVANGTEGTLEERIMNLEIKQDEGIVWVLNTLTNTQGLGGFTRALLSEYIGDLDFGDTNAVDMTASMDKIKNELAQPVADHKIEWYNMLDSIKKMAIFIINIGDGGEMDAQKLQDLLDSVSDNPLFAEIISDLIVDQINESTGISINVPAGAESDFIDTIKGNDSLMDMFDMDNEENLDYNEEDDLLKILGNKDKLLDMEERGVTIDVSNVAEENALKDAINSMTDDETERERLNNLFNLNIS